MLLCQWSGNREASLTDDIMPKCNRIGQHLTSGDYCGATDNHRGRKYIYCNIDGSKKEVGYISASVVGHDDEAKICMKCDNLDDVIKKECFCKSPGSHANFTSKRAIPACILIK